MKLKSPISFKDGNMDSKMIKVTEIIGTNLCIDSEDGKLVKEKIADGIRNYDSVIVSFEDSEMVTTAFLNTAIGALYKDFSEEEIRNKIKLESMIDKDKALLKRVVETAKIFYKEPDRITKSLHAVMG